MPSAATGLPEGWSRGACSYFGALCPKRLPENVCFRYQKPDRLAAELKPRQRRKSLLLLFFRKEGFSA
jgi:hypothetical protein